MNTQRLCSDSIRQLIIWGALAGSLLTILIHYGYSLFILGSVSALVFIAWLATASPASTKALATRSSGHQSIFHAIVWAILMLAVASLLSAAATKDADSSIINLILLAGWFATQPKLAQS